MVLKFNSGYGLFRQFLHMIHLVAFAFLCGNIIMDYLFGKANFTKENFVLLGRSYSIAWLTIIVTGIWQIMIISFQHNYIKNAKYMTWVWLLFIKTIMGIFSAYGIELFVKFFIPQAYKRKTLKYMRLICFFILFLLSSIIREWRETQLTHKLIKPKPKNENNLNENNIKNDDKEKQKNE